VCAKRNDSGDGKGSGLETHRLNLFSLGFSRMDCTNGSQQIKRLDVEILIGLGRIEIRAPCG
jgi:hypothetical protein